MPLETVFGLSGRFNVWCGNLAAVQTGLNSLEHCLRLQDVLKLNVVKVLQELSNELGESLAIVSGARLPYEEQPRPEEPFNEESSDDTNSETTTSPETELSMRLASLIDILDKLYKLGFHIRGSDLDSSPTWSQQASFGEETDTSERESSFYKELVIDHLTSLRQGRTGHAVLRDNFSQRLIDSISLRKRYLEFRSSSVHGVASLNPPIDLEPSHQTDCKPTNQQPTGFGEVELHIKDDGGYSEISPSIDDSLSFPEPPTTAQIGSDFTCSYCSEHCHKGIGTGNAWKLHVLQDIRPYICTYANCPEPSQLFKSKRHWIKHEAAVHRRHWRCPSHPPMFYASSDGLKAHLSLSHSGMYKQSQINDIVELCVFEMAEDREFCPMCLQNAPFRQGLTHHLATHLEQIALSTLPVDRAMENSDDADSVLEQLAALFDESDGMSGSSETQIRDTISTSATELPPKYGSTSSDQELVDLSHLAELCQAETRRAYAITKNLPHVHVPAVAETERTIRTTADLLHSVKLHLREVIIPFDSTWYSLSIGSSLLFILKCLGWVWRLISISFNRHYSIPELHWIQIYDDIVPGVVLPEIFQHCSNTLREIEKYFTTTGADEEWVLWRVNTLVNDLVAIMGPTDGSLIEPSPDLWDKFRSTVTHFHCDRSLSLSESMETMQIDYAFYAPIETFMAHWWRWAFKFDFPSGYAPNWGKINHRASQSLESRFKRQQPELPERRWLYGIAIPNLNLSTNYEALGHVWRSFDSGRIMLFILEDRNSSPYVVLHQRATAGQVGAACQISLKDITITHNGNSLVLCQNNQDGEEMWARLVFETYEELKLMHYSLALLKPPKFASAEIDTMTGHLYGEETELFTADLEGFQKLGVFIDDATGMVLFEGSQRRFEHNDFRPSWIYIGNKSPSICLRYLLTTFGKATPDEAFAMKLTTDESNLVHIHDIACIDFESKGGTTTNPKYQNIRFTDSERAMDFVNLFSSHISEEVVTESGKGKGRAD
ncbi:hypothetical protein BFJ70_g17278 [Fusarium oxysporum]|nr:hypothetical protein BFJ70_g17278 [Fusarium oxysporum]